MKAIRYIVRILNSNGLWRTAYESSLRACIALTYGLKTLWTVSEVAYETIAGRYIAAAAPMLFDATQQWKHNVRAFRSKLPCDPFDYYSLA